jgi:ubiquinone/menaquinone biosynthesis C-methylase UbiE
MKQKYNYFHGNSNKNFVIDSMSKYISQKQEMDKQLEKIISPFIKGRSLDILDACCGIGHISYFLHRISPKSKFLGIDQTPYLIDEATKVCNGIKNLRFEVGDILDMKYKKKFDITINWKTLSWLPYYTDILKSLFKVTKNHIFLSSLFYNGDIDFEIKVREFKKRTSKLGFTSYYNVYSYPHFEEFVYELGAKNVKSYDFHIKKDLQKPPRDQMGTYTLLLKNGSRLQASGAVLMLWKIIRIDL